MFIVTTGKSRLIFSICKILLITFLIIILYTLYSSYYIHVVQSPQEEEKGNSILSSNNRKPDPDSDLVLENFRKILPSTSHDWTGTTTTTTTTTTTNRSNPKISKTSSRSCIIPKLLIDDPEIQEYLIHYDAMQCSPDKNWVYTDHGNYYIDSEVVRNFRNVSCDYYDIIRTDDLNYEQKKYPDYPNGSKLLGDGFRIVCNGFMQNGSQVNYTNVHFGVPYLDILHDSSPPRRAHSLNSHIFIYLFDSLSRINFIRKLPKFYKFLTEQMDSAIMEGFNIVGDGTPWTIIPMTTGFFQPELPEARKRFSNASYLDQWPFIFRDYHNAGYATAYAEEQPQWSLFSYKIKGFFNEPVIHYLRTALLLANEEASNHVPYCLGDTPKSILWIKYWKELIRMYRKIQRKTFAFMFTAETSHESYNWVQSLDDHLVEQFKIALKEGYFDNTFLIVMGDHGRRFGPVRQTQSGRLEEKLPFLAVRPPLWFRQKYPKSYANLLANRNALVTPFDLHATLKHMLEFLEDGEEGHLKHRGISLFKKIPENRRCKHAWIKPHFCACLEWQDIKNPWQDSVIRKCVNFVIKRFNELLEDAHGLCSPLKLKTLHSARLLKPNDDLLSFVESADFDNTEANLSGNKTLNHVIYQLRFNTTPNNGEYDVSVTYFLDSNLITLSIDDVSRLNEYGDQPKCIYQTHHHLRQYCYCRNKSNRKY